MEGEEERFLVQAWRVKVESSRSVPEPVEGTPKNLNFQFSILCQPYLGIDNAPKANG
jgi:hypothetical protein